jgi:hypothetical protein
MSYLAMSAAPIDNENNQNQNNNNDSIMNKKRQTYNSHTKTQKQRPNDFNHQKVNSVLKSIHNLPPDDDNNLGNYSPNGSSVSAKHSDDFKPLNPFEFPDKPVSMGGERTKKPEGMANMDSDDLVPKPVDDDDMQLQDLHSNFMNDAQVRDYYKKLVPNYTHKNSNENNKNYYPSQQPTVVSDSSNQVLIEKLNYMINLLEEQQDQKTNSVTEEVVLYSFLGVFIIFVVDSFARVGKYTR